MTTTRMCSGLAQAAAVSSVLLLVGAAAPQGSEAVQASPAELAAMVDNVLTPFWRSSTMNREGLFFGERKAGEPVMYWFSLNWTRGRFG